MKLTDLPDSHGHFGPYGGIFVAETLMAALEELRVEYDKARNDPAFMAEFEYELKHYVGRPSPVYHAKRLSEQYGGAQIYLKREDLNHTGAHKINNTIGQALLARRMGKKRVIAETGAGQHGVATATVAARYGMECVVYMGAEDIMRQAPNVFRMKLLGATVVPVSSGSKTLKDALNEAMRDWVTNVESTFYILGTAAGPHPYPDAGARFPVRDRPRSPAQMPRNDRPPARCGDRLRRRRFQRHRHFPSLHPDDRCAPDRRRSRRARASPAASMPRRCRPAARACCTASAAI